MTLVECKKDRFYQPLIGEFITDANSDRCLETAEQVDEERVADGGGQLQDPPLRQQRLQLVPVHHVRLLQRLDGVVLRRAATLRQRHLREKEI